MDVQWCVPMNLCVYSGMLKRVVTFQVDVHWSFQRCAQTDVHLCEFWCARINVPSRVPLSDGRAAAGHRTRDGASLTGGRSAFRRRQMLTQPVDHNLIVCVFIIMLLTITTTTVTARFSESGAAVSALAGELGWFKVWSQSRWR